MPENCMNADRVLRSSNSGMSGPPQPRPYQDMHPGRHLKMEVQVSFSSSHVRQLACPCELEKRDDLQRRIPYPNLKATQRKAAQKL